MELTDDNHARIVIDQHPELSGPVELDVATEEADKLQTTKLELVHITVYGPNLPPRRVVLEAKALGSTFGNLDMTKILGEARKVERSGGKTRKPRGSTGAAAAPAGKAEKVNYATVENMGMIHRGRITEDERALVREDPDRASKNREAQTGKPIDFTDPAEKKRYDL